MTTGRPLKHPLRALADDPAATPVGPVIEIPGESTSSTFTMLGKQARGPISAVDIDTFEAPGAITTVTFSSAEFTALCPVTGQPDLYRFTFTYQPRRLCLESKALKLYLLRFRNLGVFCEILASEILRDLTARLDPVSASITLHQQVRGGLELAVRADSPCAVSGD